MASDELDSSGPVRRFRVRLHLLICRECRRYAEQLRVIGETAREKIKSLARDTESIARLEKSILDDAFGAFEDKR